MRKGISAWGHAIWKFLEEVKNYIAFTESLNRNYCTDGTCEWPGAVKQTDLDKYLSEVSIAAFVSYVSTIVVVRMVYYYIRTMKIVFEKKEQVMKKPRAHFQIPGKL